MANIAFNAGITASAVSDIFHGLLGFERDQVASTTAALDAFAQELVPKLAALAPLAISPNAQTAAEAQTALAGLKATLAVRAVELGLQQQAVQTAQAQAMLGKAVDIGLKFLTTLATAAVIA